MYANNYLMFLIYGIKRKYLYYVELFEELNAIILVLKQDIAIVKR